MYNNEDGRKNPVSKHYVASLERQVATLEESLRQVRSSAAQFDNTPILDVLAIRDDLREVEQNNCDTTNDNPLREARAGKLLIDPPSPSSPHKHSSYQGPTSIYRLGVVHGQRELCPARQDTGTSLYCTISVAEPAVDEILRSFFRWQYHDYMFIYREAFLLDYLNHEYEGRYCSLALVYAICALGCIPTKQTDPEMMNNFVEKAYSGLASLETLHVDSTAIQALLSLSFCELALGNISKVWLLSGQSTQESQMCQGESTQLHPGMAFRAVHDIGIHYDGSNEREGLEAEIQRRIYWGCYTSDR